MARTPATSQTGVANVVVRSMEHCSGVFKRVFAFTKVRYHGLKKNTGCS
jgi:hypothetical protein